jgi:hypothetical protein
MYLKKKKEKLYVTDLLTTPASCYPCYYLLSTSMKENELLHNAIIALHSYHFSAYHIPESFHEIFTMLHSGCFPIYKEKYIIGYFGQKMMYLESHGWRALPAVEELFKLENWLVN